MPFVAHAHYKGACVQTYVTLASPRGLTNENSLHNEFNAV